jgi:hypothetical protein
MAIQNYLPFLQSAPLVLYDEEAGFPDADELCGSLSPTRYFLNN